MKSSDYRGQAGEQRSWIRRSFYRLGLLSVAIISLLASSLLQFEMSTPHISSWMEDPHTYVDFLRDLGFAFFIALVILFTVDEFNRAQQKKESDEERERIKLDVFEAVFGVSLPEDVRHSVRDNILTKKFIRKKSSATYEIIPKEFKRADGSHVTGVLLKAHSSFVVKNVSGNKEDYSFTIFVEKPQLANLLDPLKDVNIEKVCIDGVDLLRQQIDQDPAEPQGDALRRLVHRISVGPGLEVPIDFSFSAIRGFDDSELWVSIIPNDGMKLEVRVPPHVVSVGAASVHPSAIVKTHSSVETGFYAWELRDTVLPFNGIMLWWRLSDAPADRVPVIRPQPSETGGAERTAIEHEPASST